MSDEPTDDRVDRPVMRRVLIRNRWRAISFVGHLRFLIRYLPPRPTEMDTDQGNQGYSSNRTEGAEDDDRYEPGSKAFTDLGSRGSSHVGRKRCLPVTRSGSCDCKRSVW